MDSISKEQGRKKNKKTLLRERNRRASLMRKCIKNKIIQNHEPGNRLSITSKGESGPNVKNEPQNSIQIKGGEKLNIKSSNKLNVNKDNNNEIIPIKLTKNDNFEREDSSQVNEIHGNHTLVTEQLNSAGHILDGISVTLENMQCLIMRSDYRKSDIEQTLHRNKRVLRSEKRKMQNDLICLKEEISKVKKLFEDAKNENEEIRKHIEKLMKKNSYLRASEKYKTELCEDLHDKIAALESNKTVKYYWSQS